ncbi:MAG: hypothetical protein DDT18_01155 [Actinobacteria bacterium]|nr:hypothetical protein [Actinomycetota bacterium]
MKKEIKEKIVEIIDEFLNDWGIPQKMAGRKISEEIADKVSELVAQQEKEILESVKRNRFN